MSLAENCVKMNGVIPKLDQLFVVFSFVYAFKSVILNPGASI